MNAQELVELFPAASTLTVQQAAEAYLKARSLKDEADALAKRQSEILSRAESTLLAVMEQSHTLAVKVTHEGQAVTLSAATQTFYGMTVEAMQKQDVRDWLALMGGSDLLRYSVHPQTLSSFCRELVDKQAVLHEDVRVTEKRTIRMRRE